MDKLFKYLFLLVTIIMSCKKIDSDYRDKYIGNYTFNVIYTYPILRSDTVFGISQEYSYNGSIRKTDGFNNKITVDWGKDTIWAFSLEVIEHRCVLTIDSSGVLSYPTYPDMDNNNFYSPAYIKGDSIKFNFSAGGNAMFSTWTIKGFKKK